MAICSQYTSQSIIQRTSTFSISLSIFVWFFRHVPHYYLYVWLTVISQMPSNIKLIKLLCKCEINRSNNNIKLFKLLILMLFTLRYAIVRSLFSSVTSDSEVCWLTCTPNDDGSARLARGGCPGLEGAAGEGLLSTLTLHPSQGVHPTVRLVTERWQHMHQYVVLCNITYRMVMLLSIATL